MTSGAMESMLSEFDYFTPTILQSAIVSEYDEAISPVNTIGPAGNALGQFEFNIPGAPDLYRDLNNSYLMLSLKLVDANGGNLGGQAAVAPVNLALHSMFTNVSLKLCGKDITDKDSLYPYRAYLETLLTFDEEVLKTRAIAEGWSKDEGATMNNATFVGAQGQPDPNAGFIARQKLISGSRTYTLVGRPHLDLFHQALDIPPDCPMTIKFNPAPVAFSFIGLIAHAAVRVLVMAATLYVRTKLACPELILAHKQMLETCNMRIPHNRVTVSSYGIAQGFTAATISLNFPTKLPKRIFIGLVANTAAAGVITENPFNFQNFGLTSIHLKANGKQVPADGLTMDYATGDYQRAYLNTLATLGLDNSNRAVSLTPAEFAQGFNLYGFKLAPGPIDGTVFSTANGAGSLVVCMKFAAGLAAAVDMIVFAETPAILEIDKLSQAILV